MTPKQRFQLANGLKLEDKSQPIRRVWIPKPGRNEKRPLGIPVMRDRATQALVKAAIEPEWESKFENNSYGFRPGRSAHDAIEAIFNQIRYKSKFVLDADIAKCFDRINHHHLLAKLNTFPIVRRQIRAWLRADICDFEKNQKSPNRQGTPQGGVISPLLSNIALHGMENKIKQIKGASLIRYADDFVIFHENLTTLKVCQNVVSEWLSHYDLELKPSKTQIVHTLNRLEKQQPGFDFLGFNIRQYKVGKYQSGKNGQGELLGFKTIIRPSSNGVRRHYQKLSMTIGRLNAAPQEKIISELNPIIRGWCNYYRTVCSQETYSKVGYLTHKRLRRWADRRHPNKGKYWVGDKYWITIGGDNWVFGKEYKDDFITLERHTKTAIVRHVKIRGNKTPYDGDIIYWAKRKGSHPELKPSTAKLLKKQNGKCNWCGLNFLDGDLIETDHIIPKRAGGSNSKDNLQLLHKHCHLSKTYSDQLVIKLHKAKKSGEKIQKWFNNLDWQWVDDIPTLLKVGTHKEPGKRGAQ